MLFLTPRQRFPRPGVLCSPMTNNSHHYQSVRAPAVCARSTLPELDYSKLFQSAQYGLVIADLDTRVVVDANPFGLDLLARPRTDVVGKQLWEIGLLEDSKTTEEVFHILREHRQVAYDNLPVVTGDSRQREIELVGNVYANGARDLVQFVLRDCTDHRSAEETVGEVYRQLSFHVENTPLAVIEWDSNFRLSRWSTSAERIFGWKSEEVLGKRIGEWKFVFADDIEAVRAITSRQQQGIEQHSVSRNRNYTKDGATLHCEWYNSVLYDRAGKLQSVLSLVLDVTARRQAEEEVVQLLAREQEARREAEYANRSKDEFLATLSHELRTPLASILGWARLLTSDMIDKEKYGQVFETIVRNAKAQSQLIDDLLEVSRIITGKLRLEVRRVELGAVIEATVESVRPAADAKKIRFRLKLDRHAGEISGDPDRLQQLIWNLLSNAIKFTPAGGHVEIRLERVDAHAQLTVIDSGHGISPEFLPHVFERFRQADGSSSRRYGGLGLGLAIVRHLAELHGGTVQAESPGEGMGATFTVKLPLIARGAKKPAVTSAEVWRRKTSPSAELAAHRESLTGLRVLVVDDESDVRKLATMMFKRCGAESTAVGSVKEAMALMQTWLPDVLVADIGMPGEDGYDLIRQVRAQPAERGGRIPAMALTAYARHEDRLRILSAGYQVHVAKPVEPAELVAAVASLAGRVIAG